MSIHEVTDTDVVQRCAHCGVERRVALDDLDVGVERDGQVDPLLVPLPPCLPCGSSEVLVRAPDDEPEYPSPGVFGHLHRLLVDYVHAELVRRDRVVSGLRAPDGHVLKTLARPVNKSLLERWFPHGMKIDTPAREQPGAAEEAVLVDARESTPEPSAEPSETEP